MKNILLPALSLLLLGNCPVLADNETSAGAAPPAKVGSGNLKKTQATGTSQKQNAKPRQTGKPAPAAINASPSNLPFGSFSNQPAETPGQKPGFAAPGVTKTVGSQTGVVIPSLKKESGKPLEKKALGGKGLIPPPPDVLKTGQTAGTDKDKKPAKAAKAAAPVEKLITVGTGGPYNFTGKPKEEFATNFNWNPESPADILNFKATFTPISNDRTHFNWLRILLGNQILADERALKGKNTLTLDLTGKVEKGSNQITVSGQGTPGATLDWKLTTPKKCTLSSLNPDEVVVGKDLTLKGQNFDPTPAKDVISLSSKTFVPSTASATELKVRIPKDFTPGEYLVKVTIDGLSSHELKVIVRGIPELTGTSLNGVPPGATLVIFGKNFSKKLNDNQVLFDSTPAQVIACTTSELTVLVPNFENQMVGDTAHLSGQVGIPIRVKVGKIDSINTVPINVGNSTWQDPGLKGGPDTPQVPVDWRRLLEN